MWAGFPFFLIWLMRLFSVIRWSTVAFAGFPPACASLISISSLILLFIILSYSFPKLLSLESFPLQPFHLYSLMISPFCQPSGISLLLLILLRVSRNIFLVSCVDSKNISFGILSGLLHGDWFFLRWCFFVVKHEC